MLNIITSNRMETLADKLAKALSENEKDWTSKDTVIIQSKGMERWLNMQLAQKNKISANIDYPFPKAYVVRLLKKYGLLADDTEASREVNCWKIFIILPTLFENTEFKALKNYVGTSTDRDLRRFQLSAKIADLFDNYLIFRPEMAAYWGGEKVAFTEDLWDSSPWQKTLWKLVYSSKSSMFSKAVHEYISKPPIADIDLPDQIHLFGLSSLPPLLLQFFNALSVTVNFYYLSPCNHYWADQQREKFLINQNLKDNDELWDEGNPLLASMGTLGRDFLKTIVDVTDGDVGEGDGFGEITDCAPGMLGVLQSDVLEYVVSDEKVAFEADHTVIVNSCHCRMREVEVLYDQLLRYFDTAEGELEPSDIIVMAPDISKYAPYIRAVFDNPDLTRSSSGIDTVRFDYSIADGSLMQDSVISKIFFNILGSSTSRLTSREVLEIFDNEFVYRRFKMTEEDVSLIKNYIIKSRICWGMDADHRSSLSADMPAFNENSWRFGLDRLMMGYAVPEDGFDWQENDIFPCDIGVKEGLVLGRFMDFLDQLFEVSRDLAKQSARTATEWQEFVARILKSFFIRNNETAAELLEISRLASTFKSQLERASCTDKVELAIVKSWFNQSLGDDSAAHGFLNRGITFCKMLPMRSIPSKIVCILGLNDGQFPRMDKKLSFDLIASDPKPGDRSIRKDDRYLFLEAILSARDNIYLSYIGQSIKDNEEMPPSIILSEFLDYVDSRFERGADKVSSLLLTKHPLQAFGGKYFDNTKDLFSYSMIAQSTAASIHGRSFEHKSEGNYDVPLSGTYCEEIRIDDLLLFFNNPSEYYLRNCLRVNLKAHEEELPDETERFGAGDSLVKYNLNDQLLKMLLEEECDSANATSAGTLLRAQGELPVGMAGELLTEELFTEAEKFASRIKSQIDGKEESQPVDISINLNTTLGPVKLTGTIGSLYGTGVNSLQLLYHFGKSNAARYIKGKLMHLLAVAGEAAYGTVFIFKAHEERYNVTTKETATDLLVKAVELFMKWQNNPLPLFPESGKAFYDTIFKLNEKPPKIPEDSDEDIEVIKLKQALAKAATAWESTGNNFYADKANVSISHCFGKAFPGNELATSQAFIDTSMEFFGQILAEVK